LRLIESGKKRVRDFFHAVGLEVSRLSRTPGETLLGLRTAGIRTVIDIGANRGQFARHISRLIPEANLFCFEPLAGPFSELERWARHDSAGRAKAFNVGLGDRSGTTQMFEHIDHSTSSSLLTSTELAAELYPILTRQAPREVRIARLDDFIVETGIELKPEVLIKLDVQGYESRVISGAQKSIRAAKACIVEVSFDHLYDGQPTFADLWKTFDLIGYRFVGNIEQNYAVDGHVIFADAVFTR
jgi:FkbM family methyltransferase